MGPWLRQWVWLLRRDWQVREVRIMVAALWVAVATVATVSLFADRLQQSVDASGRQFLAADRQLRGSFKAPQAWQKEAERLGLRHARMVRFSTMLSASRGLQLTEIKAVGAHYPLAGQVQVRDGPGSPILRLDHGPSRGRIWVDARLLSLLNIRVGDRVGVGRLKLQISRILVQEPDASFSFGGLAPHALMNLDDVPATGVVQPGSRMRWVDFFSGPNFDLERFHRLIRPELRPDQRWVGIREGRPAVSRTIERAHRYLLLGGSLAVMLALVAIAVASRQYAVRQLDAVALLKTLGLTHRRIAGLYAGRLLVWGLVGTLLGLLTALPFSYFLLHLARQLLAAPLVGAYRLTALWPGLVTAVVAMAVFAFPPIWRLRKVPPMRVLRDLSFRGAGRVHWDLALAIPATLALLWLYGRELWLVMALSVGALVLGLSVVALGYLGLAALKRLRHGRGLWRLALLGIRRHQRSALSQVAVTALVVMLAAVLYLVRTSLLQDWRAQLPPDAPNEFLINIAPGAVAQIRGFLNDHHLEASRFYPMVRGRLTAINGRPADQVVTNPQSVEALHRELNLTWSATLPPGNRLVSGHWWSAERHQGLQPISVEQRLAKELGLSLGDRVTFVIGDRQINARVASIRTADWQSMRPNFFIIFPPKALNGFPVTWINSFYLPITQRDLLTLLSKRFPTVTVLDIDHLLSRVRAIVDQVVGAVQALLVMVLVAAVLVVIAVLSATLPERKREGALLRTLGGSRRQIRYGALLEFALMGLTAGLIGVGAAELVVWALQYRLFSGEFRWHLSVWLWLPPAAALLLALVGVAQLRDVVRVSPMTLLRSLD